MAFRNSPNNKYKIPRSNNHIQTFKGNHSSRSLKLCIHLDKLLQTQNGHSEGTELRLASSPFTINYTLMLTQHSKRRV